MKSNPQSNQLDEIFTDLNTSFQNYSELNPEQRIEDLHETCFSRAMLVDSPIKNVAGNISSFSMFLSIYLTEKNLSYKEFIETLNLSTDRSNLLLEFEYDFSIIKPIGGPTPLSNKPINKSLIVMYSKVTLAIFTSLGAVGTFIQPLVDIQNMIQEKEQNEIDIQMELERILQKNRELDQKDRELDQKDRELDQNNPDPISPQNNDNHHNEDNINTI